MKAKTVVCLSLVCSFFVFSSISVQSKEIIRLPQPQIEAGMPLMKALSQRKSQRSFAKQELPRQLISNLLWAACGINRPESGKRTAPSAVNWQEIDIYVAMASGLYVYEPREHALVMVLNEDMRADTGEQPFVKDAPINLIYVADFSKVKGRFSDDKSKEFYSATDTGFISQNVYLFCAQEGLATVVRGWVNKERLAKSMGLSSDQKVILCQSVGYPAQ